MNGVRSPKGLFPVLFVMLLVLAAVLVAQTNPQKQNNNSHNPPPKGQAVQGSKPQGHPAAPKPSPAAHTSTPKGAASGGRLQPGGKQGGAPNQGNRPATGQPSRTQAGAAVSRPSPSARNPPAGGKTFGTNGAAGRPAGGKTFGTNGAPGHPSVSRSANTTVFRAPGGERRIVHNLPGGGVAVANARGHGYVQRSVTVRGSVFVQRTYYVGGRPQALYYRPYLYRGIAFNVYAPTRFYAPRFYLWAANPWAAPVYYNWGWAGTPWFGFYGGYFAPYPRYMGPNLWLTDYLLANALQAAYQERLDAAAAAAANSPAPPPGPDAVAPGGQVTLTAEVKQAIADEVRQELAQERAESQAAQSAPAAQAPPPSPAAATAPPPALLPNATHVFIVSSVVVVTANGQQCAVTQGDVLQLDPAPMYPDPSNARVLASKAADCQTGKAVQIGLADLQEMQNHMRETLDQGLGEMQARQGQGNLPVIDASMRTQTPAPYAADLPAPDANVASELQQTAQASGPQEPTPLPVQSPRPAPAAGPSTIVIGQTIGQVVALLGQPVTKVDGGQKTIFVYKNLKITFIGGKVSDVQ